MKKRPEMVHLNNSLSKSTINSFWNVKFNKKFFFFFSCARARSSPTASASASAARVPWATTSRWTATPRSSATTATGTAEFRPAGGRLRRVTFQVPNSYLQIYSHTLVMYVIHYDFTYYSHSRAFTISVTFEKLLRVMTTIVSNWRPLIVQLQCDQIGRYFGLWATF